MKTELEYATFPTKRAALDSIKNSFFNDSAFNGYLSNFNVKVSIVYSESIGSDSFYYYVELYNNKRECYETFYKVRISDHEVSPNWAWRSKDAEILIEDVFFNDADEKRWFEIEAEETALRKSLHNLPKGKGDFFREVEKKRALLLQEKVELSQRKRFTYLKSSLDEIKADIINKLYALLMFGILLELNFSFSK